MAWLDSSFFSCWRSASFSRWNCCSCLISLVACSSRWRKRNSVCACFSLACSSCPASSFNCCPFSLNRLCAAESPATASCICMWILSWICFLLAELIRLWVRAAQSAPATLPLANLVSQSVSTSSSVLTASNCLIWFAYNRSRCLWIVSDTGLREVMRQTASTCRSCASLIAALKSKRLAKRSRSAAGKQSPITGQ